MQTDLEVQLVKRRQHDLLVLLRPPDQREHGVLPGLRRSELVLGGSVQDVERELDIALERRFQKPNRALYDLLHRVSVAAEEGGAGEGRGERSARVNECKHRGVVRREGLEQKRADAKGYRGARGKARANKKREQTKE